ncbi:MAG: glutamine synthetase family protein, partial [Candidatus Micrarchaeia archaeon]
KAFNIPALPQNFLEGIPATKVSGLDRESFSDVFLIPDMETYAPLPWQQNTARVLCDVADEKKQVLENEPREVARRAAKFVEENGFSEVMSGAEIRFSVFDSISYNVATPYRMQAYSVESREAVWNSFGQNFPMDLREGAYSVSPKDLLQMLRFQAAGILEGIFKIKSINHNHGDSPGQCEISLDKVGVRRFGDVVITTKYVIRNIAVQTGGIATFMPKPIYGGVGNSLHIHQSLLKEGRNVFYNAEEYANMSQTARYYIGGIIEHAGALCALCCGSTNSYKRLGHEKNAPSVACWGKGNRMAMVRIPANIEGEKDARIEIRLPDPSCNPYLAISAIVCAGLDGIKRKVECGEPVEKDVRSAGEEGMRKRKALPKSLGAALSELESDNGFLASVFTKSILTEYIEVKRAEERRVESSPTPIEFKLYMDL